MDRILTVVTPAASKNMTTCARFKRELGITDNASDALIDDYVKTASRAAAHKCRGELIAEGVSEQFRPYPFIDSGSLTNLPEFIYLRRLPVIQVNTVVEDSVLVDGVTEDGVILVEGTDFELDYKSGRMVRLYNDIPLRWHFRKLAVPYTGGYTFPGTLEPDIEQAVIEIMKDVWFARLRDPLLKSQNVSGVLQSDYWVGGVGDDGWPPKVTDLLAPFQRPMF